MINASRETVTRAFQVLFLHKMLGGTVTRCVWWAWQAEGHRRGTSRPPEALMAAQ